MESSPNVTRYWLLVTGYAWRLAILLLPWQIRWFSEGAMVGGYPWEQGRISFYLSWLPMLATIAFVIARRVIPPHPVRRLTIVGFILFLLPSLFSIYPRATIEWWIEVAILAGFVWSLYQLHVSARSLVVWFALSLIPHALLGLWQFQAQFVFGSEWLGIATQNSLTKGVSVIEQNGLRILRAYGGFPHPNIFGGWLAVALPMIVWLSAATQNSKLKIQNFGWVTLSGLYSIALVLTFSRSAWIACVVGLLLITWHVLHSPPLGGGVRGGVAAIVVILLCAFGMLAVERTLVFPRVDVQGTLEQKSIDERKQGLHDGWRLFLSHPLVGVGPGATASALQSQIIPHFVPLLILDEVGIVGIGGLILIVYFLYVIAKSSTTKQSLPAGEIAALRQTPLAMTPWVPFITLLVLSFFDHYPWSLWSGRALTALTIAFWMLSLQNGEIVKE